MDATPTRAAIYCRLSYAPDGSLEKVERQEADCRGLANRLGWSVGDGYIYQDNSRSAWKRDRVRPGWDALLAAVERCDVDGIIVYHGDRLVRQPWDLEMLLRLADERHLPLASVSGVRDLSSSDDRFIVRIEAAQACKSSDDTSRRVRRGWEARAQQGRPSGGGKRPYGFSDLTTPDPVEASILTEAAQRVLGHQSLNGVVEWLNEVSVTSQGNRWTPRSLKHLLVAPRIAGLVRHGPTGQLYEAVWPPIVTRAEWEDLAAMLAKNGVAHPHRGAQPTYLLSGIARCGLCGSSLRTKPSGGRNRKTKRLYGCLNPGCRKIGRDVTHLDEYVIGRVLRRLAESDLMDEITTEPVDGSAAEIVTLERRRRETVEQLEALADNPSISPELAARAIESFDSRISGLRDRRAASARSRLLSRMAGVTRAQWDAEPLDVRRSTVRALYTVTVHPTEQRGPGFDRSAIEMTRVEA